MRKIATVLIACSCQLAYGAKPPQAVIESCLLGYVSENGTTVLTSDFGYSWIVEDIPGYQLMWPEGMQGVRVGYATNHKTENDYIFAEKHRGFIKMAIPLTNWKPERIEPPQNASYGIVKRAGRNYICVVTAPGQGSAAFYRAGYIGQLPSAKRRNIQLYYAVIDIKKLKGFKAG